MRLISNEWMIKFLRIHEQLTHILTQQYGCVVDVSGFQEVESGEQYIAIHDEVVPAAQLYHVFKIGMRRADRRELEIVTVWVSKAELEGLSQEL